MKYVLKNFFTHKDYLINPCNIKGTLFTPLHFIFESILILLIILCAIYTIKHKEIIKKQFTYIFIFIVIAEIIVDIWDSYAGINKGFNLAFSLPLYPCSLFIFTLPFIIWGKDDYKYAACGYICTLGLFGALFNFLYPFTYLQDYSCISFRAFHTFIYHGLMIYVAIIVLGSKMHSFKNIDSIKKVILPFIPALFLSIPSIIVNVLINSDYMYFMWQNPVIKCFTNMNPCIKTHLLTYLVYFIICTLPYIPSYIKNKSH